MEGLFYILIQSGGGEKGLDLPYACAYVLSPYSLYTFYGYTSRAFLLFYKADQRKPIGSFPEAPFTKTNRISLARLNETQSEQLNENASEEYTRQ